DDLIAVAAKIFDRRDQAEIDLPCVQQSGADARQVVADRESICPGFDSFDEGARVQVGDRADADTRHQVRGSKRPARSTGSPDAATMLRRISSSGARRLPSGASSSGDTLSTSS